MSEALDSEPLYERVQRALTDEFRDVPVLTILVSATTRLHFKPAGGPYFSKCARGW